LKYLLTLITLFSFSHALIITPEDTLKQTFHATTITKKSKILTKKEHQAVQKMAKTKLKSKLYRVYKAQNGETTLGYGILLTQMVRSKSTAVLYIIDTMGALKSIEIVAFNEPKEYLPSKRWLKQFDNNQAEHFSTQDGNINSVSGATLSANAIVKVANLAHAIWKVKHSK
jgi:hypothetical protein